MICKKCEKDKKLYEFYKDTTRKSGYYPYCKQCKNKEYKEYRIKYPWKATLINIKQRCNNKNTKFYNKYGGRGIKCLIIDEELKKLWFRDKAYLMKEPTIDRIDNDGNYTYKNCRYIEHTLNRIKSHIDSPRDKKILQYNINGKFIKEWSSIKKASKELQIHPYGISACAKNKRKTAGGFMWRYKK